MFLPIFLSFCLFRCTTAVYVLQDDYNPSSFLDMFNFFTDPDPTQGYVKYVDEGTARGAGLVQQRSSSVYLGVDSQTMNPPQGRQSVRLESKASYDQGLIILDLAHMPGSTCGTWPAFWTVGPQWPSNGEIDIIEGVNSQQANSMALHTNPGCSINDLNLPNADNVGAGRRRFSGQIKTGNCDVNAPGQGANVGCAIATQDDSTYGDGFNNAGGGVYATEWTPQAISVYHFARANIPADITSGQPDPTTWGTPLAVFNGCNFRTAVANQTIVFNVAMCGQWAGQQAVWQSDAVCSQKAATCQDYVANNPGAFANSFWEINGLKVYQQQANAPAPAPAPGSSQPAAPLPSSTSALAPAPSTMLTIPGPGGPRPTSTIIVTTGMTTTVTRGGQTGRPRPSRPFDDCNDNARGGCISRAPGRRPPNRVAVPVQQEGFIGR